MSTPARPVPPCTALVPRPHTALHHPCHSCLGPGVRGGVVRSGTGRYGAVRGGTGWYGVVGRYGAVRGGTGRYGLVRAGTGGNRAVQGRYGVVGRGAVRGWHWYGRSSGTGRYGIWGRRGGTGRYGAVEGGTGRYGKIWSAQISIPRYYQNNPTCLDVQHMPCVLQGPVRARTARTGPYRPAPPHNFDCVARTALYGAPLCLVPPLPRAALYRLRCGPYRLQNTDGSTAPQTSKAP